MLFLVLGASLINLVFNTGCAPKIYIIDRHTVLEEEAAGHWPQFEKELLEKAKAQGPTAYPKRPPNQKRDRLLNVINGKLVAGKQE